MTVRCCTYVSPHQTGAVRCEYQATVDSPLCYRHLKIVSGFAEVSAVREYFEDGTPAVRYIDGCPP